MEIRGPESDSIVCCDVGEDCLVRGLRWKLLRGRCFLGRIEMEISNRRRTTIRGGEAPALSAASGRDHARSVCLLSVIPGDLDGEQSTLAVATGTFLLSLNATSGALELEIQDRRCCACLVGDRGWRGVFIGKVGTVTFTPSTRQPGERNGSSRRGGSGPTHSQVGIQSSSAAVVDGTVYFGCRDSHLYALDANSGQKKWAFGTEGSWVVSSPAVRMARFIL